MDPPSPPPPRPPRRFQLQSLRGLELIGEQDPKIRDAVTEFHLEHNQLTSLVELCVFGSQPLFTKVGFAVPRPTRARQLSF